MSEVHPDYRSKTWCIGALRITVSFHRDRTRHACNPSRGFGAYWETFNLHLQWNR